MNPKDKHADWLLKPKANVLADHLEKYFDSEPYTSKVVTMLRKQQAEIEALKRHRDRLETLAEKMLQGSGEEDEQ